MAASLVHIVKKEILERKREIKAVGMDFDGNLTDLHRPEIYELFWKNILGFLPDNIRMRLQRYAIQDIIQSANFKAWHFLDTAFGYAVIADQNGRILAVKKGNEHIRKEELLKTYGTDKTIDTSYPLNPDYDKPRFLPCCDAFDLLECAIKALVARTGGFPKKSTLKEVDRAFYQAHHSEDGFKRDLLENPEQYGIGVNKQLKDFLEKVHRYYKTFLLTSSPEDYTIKMLDALGISAYFDAVISNAKKPACFLPDSDENRALWERLNKIGVGSAHEILYAGDHLYKDSIPASRFGAFTCLRAEGTAISEIEQKLRKYAGIDFERAGHFVVPKNSAKEVQAGRLNSTLSQLCRHVHALTTKVQNLEPLLLY